MFEQFLQILYFISCFLCCTSLAHYSFYFLSISFKKLLTFLINYVPPIKKGINYAKPGSTGNFIIPSCVVIYFYTVLIRWFSIFFTCSALINSIIVYYHVHEMSINLFFLCWSINYVTMIELLYNCHMYFKFIILFFSFFILFLKPAFINLLISCELFGN